MAGEGKKQKTQQEHGEEKVCILREEGHANGGRGALQSKRPGMGAGASGLQQEGNTGTGLRAFRGR